MYGDLLLLCLEAIRPYDGGFSETSSSDCMTLIQYVMYSALGFWVLGFRGLGLGLDVVSGLEEPRL